VVGRPHFLKMLMLFVFLKGLSHEIEMNYNWYNSTEPT
jgi:hypothetical protein